MKKIKYINIRYSLKAIIVLMLLCLLSQNISAKTKNVLFIGSYDPTFPTYFSQILGLRREFMKKNINLETMYMNKKRDLSSKGDSVFIHQLKYRMSIKPEISGIVVGDDDAFLFALEEQNKIFKNLPISFLGVNNKTLAYKQDENKNITGVVEDVSMGKTIDLIFELLPKTKRVIAISDATKPGMADLDNFFSLIKNRNNHSFSNIDLSKISFSEFKKKLLHLNKDDVLLLLSCYIDKNDSVISFQEGVNILNACCSVPVFHLWEHGIGSGLLGGYVVSQTQQGVCAAKLMIKKITNPKINVLVKRNSPNGIILDNNILNKFDISLKNISNIEDVKIINEKENVLKKYREIFIPLSITIFILIVVITFLLYRSFKNKQLSQLLKEKMDAAQSANNLKSAFLANMSHEIRTPLNAIVGFSNLLIDEDLEKEEKKTYSDIITSNSDFLLKLINDILDISKIDAGFITFEYNTIDVIYLIKHICMSLQGLACNRNDELVFVSNYKSMNIQYDPNRFTQVLNNLLTNSIKFTKNGKIEILFYDLGNSIKVSVKDTGIGISLDKQEKVFKRFAKLNTYTQGTGLGLSLCKSIVETTGGKIYFYSKPNHGACFSFEIPKDKIN